MTSLTMGTSLLLVWFAHQTVERDTGHTPLRDITAVQAQEATAPDDTSTPWEKEQLPPLASTVKFHCQWFHWRAGCPLVLNDTQFWQLSRGQAEARHLVPCYYCSHPRALAEYWDYIANRPGCNNNRNQGHTTS